MKRVEHDRSIVDDEARERRIAELGRVIEASCDSVTRRHYWLEMQAEICARSSAQVARMERARGLSR
ncbi:hypothetical protein G3O06_10365 [Burkholderia sp. Ac-20345]|uniref:hypothetical protein n=1 Tax=Burkholderia sp. Ac-20345 TaxID=2703891 RepID=UPI00197BD6C0|nr:hypothetical protein [Burkholderia sp. Ac-20345]MBN3777956.1 hypothetical protein [Burkholderia sp. Ac-20345]